MSEKITAGYILDTLRVMVESKQVISKDEWINVAFKLNLLRIDEAKELNRRRQEVAKRKLEIKQKQEKVNISAIELEVEATDEYREMKDKEDLIYSIDQFVMIAKKSSDSY